MEIEAGASACHGVAQAAVLALRRGRRADSARARAPTSPASAATTAIRRSCAASSRLRVPAYMLARGDRVFVDAFAAQTPSGKDRPRGAGGESRRPNRRRRAWSTRRATRIERAVARRFADLLAARARSAATTILPATAATRCWGSELQIAACARAFRRATSATQHADATVAGIAAEVRERLGPARRRARAPMPVIVPLWRQAGTRRSFLVHGRHGQAFVSPHFMRLLGDEQPVCAFQARGARRPRAPHPTVEANGRTTICARCRPCARRAPYFIGALCAGAYVAAAMARALRRDAGEAVLPLLLLDPPERLLHGGLRADERGDASSPRCRRAARAAARRPDDADYLRTVRRVR
jgi:hypothetical protein